MTLTITTILETITAQPGRIHDFGAAIPETYDVSAQRQTIVSRPVCPERSATANADRHVHARHPLKAENPGTRTSPARWCVIRSGEPERGSGPVSTPQRATQHNPG